jgi:hypothetical protein
LNKVALLCCMGAILSSTTAYGADFSGIWTGTTTDRNGDLQDLSFRFTQSGDKVTGKMYGDNESTPIESVNIVGDQISFMVTTELNGAISKFLYTGTIQGGEMDLLRKRVGVKPDPAVPEKPAALEKDAADAAAKAVQNQNTKLRLKRLA